MMTLTMKSRDLTTQMVLCIQTMTMDHMEPHLIMESQIDLWFYS